MRVRSINHNRISGHIAINVLGVVLALSLVLLNLWGVIWSFQRHGTGHGVAALIFPPYALYRGTAYLWEDPLWSAEWDQQTEKIGMVVLIAGDDAFRVDMIEDVQDAKKWLLSLPEDRRIILRDRVLALARATYILTKKSVLGIVDEESSKMPDQIVMSESMSLFSVDAGLMRAWNRMVIEYDATKRALQEEFNRLDSSDQEKKREYMLRELERIIAVQQDQMARTITDLFPSTKL